MDETNVEMSTEANFLAAGKANFTTFCTPCHGADAAGSENSVGPNLTDAIGYMVVAKERVQDH
ncbi:MAG: c-type cytochrome [Flavobacteriales bacterium]|nr:c-type cytochrome [Flavobacteriales bacterium]